MIPHYRVKCQQFMIAAVVFCIIPLVKAQTTYTWNGTTSNPTLESAWNPSGGPPSATDHILFDSTSSSDMTFGGIESFTAASWTFTHPTNSQTINSSGSASQLISTGDLTVNVASNRTAVIRYGGLPLSASIGGDINLDTGNLMFGANFSSTVNGRFGDLTVGGSTNIADGTTLSFGNMVGVVELGELLISGGTINVLIGSTTGNGSLNGGTNLITMTRLHGSGTIRGNKDNATELTTGHLLIDGSVDGTFSGTIIDGLENNQLRLTKGGSSTLTLSGENTYSGITAIEGGEIAAGAANSLSANSVVALSDVAGVTLELDGFNQTIAGLSGGGTTGGAVQLSDSAVLTLSTSGVANSFGGSISGNGALVVEGTGSQTITSANTYSGGTTLRGGTLIAEDADALGNASGEVAITGSSETVLRIAEGVTIGNSIAFSNSHQDSAIEKIVASAEAFSTGTSATIASDFDGGNPVAAGFLGGVSTSGTILQMRFAVSSAALNDDIRISDVFFLSETGSDIFALELSMDAVSQYAFLGWLDGSDVWVNAVAGNSDVGEHAVEGFLGSFDESGVLATSDYLGSWGVDVDGGSVWAVLDHNSAFAVIPEPRLAAFGFALLALFTSTFLKRRK